MKKKPISDLKKVIFTISSYVIFLLTIHLLHTFYYTPVKPVVYPLVILFTSPLRFSLSMTMDAWTKDHSLLNGVMGVLLTAYILVILFCVYLAGVFVLVGLWKVIKKLIYRISSNRKK
jgi:hypothetical protein